MSSTLASSCEAKKWRMPIVPESYDRSPLTSEELAALAIASRLGSKARGLTGLDYAKAELQRLQTPVYDVIALRSRDVHRCRKIRRVLYCEMAQRGTVFWQWSQDEWIEIICPTFQEYAKKHGTNGARPALMDIAYLLGGITDLRAAGQKRESTTMARYIFGEKIIEQEYKRITDVLLGQKGRGYSSGQYMQALRQTLCSLFLLNRSPYLEDLTEELLRIAVAPPDPLTASLVILISDVLQELAILPPRAKESPSVHLDSLDTSGVPCEWVEWCLAWLKQDTDLPPRQRRRHFTNLMMDGRWLAANHPGIASPEQWDESLAVEYVNYICKATAGDYASAEGLKVLITQGRVGKPLMPRSIDKRLCTMSRFFRRLQDRPHAVGNVEARRIERRFNPSEAFATPQYVRRLIQPDPRDIDEVIWCKLTYAAATLTEEDYSTLWNGYPLSYYRAAALLWVTSARRPNEIMRLQVGCIRRDWDPVMLDGHGVPLPGQEAQLCYLHIPSNKTKGPYWVPIPRYAADAVEAWERERPAKQPKHIDAKDSSLVDFLFSLRNKRMGESFLNDTLIPALCRHAGVPEEDARGSITGHRARSTIATMLRRNGLSLEDISEFLGHAKPDMVRAYARTDQSVLDVTSTGPTTSCASSKESLIHERPKLASPTFSFFWVEAQMDNHAFVVIPPGKSVHTD